MARRLGYLIQRLRRESYTGRTLGFEQLTEIERNLYAMLEMITFRLAPFTYAHAPRTKLTAHRALATC